MSIQTEVLSTLKSIDYRKSISDILYIKDLDHSVKVQFALYCAKLVYPNVRKEDRLVVDKCLELVGNWLIDKNSVSNKDLNKAAHAAVNAAAYAAEAAAYAAAANAAYAAADAAAYAAYAAAHAAEGVTYKKLYYKLVSLIAIHYNFDSKLLKVLYND